MESIDRAKINTFQAFQDWLKVSGYQNLILEFEIINFMTQIGDASLDKFIELTAWYHRRIRCYRAGMKLQGNQISPEVHPPQFFNGLGVSPQGSIRIGLGDK